MALRSQGKPGLFRFAQLQTSFGLIWARTMEAERQPRLAETARPKGWKERSDWQRSTGESVHAAYEEAKKKPSLKLIATRRMRYWSDGAVIGSKEFVAQVAAEMYGEVKAKQRRYGRGELPEGGELFSLRCLREQTS